MEEKLGRSVMERPLCNGFESGRSVIYRYVTFFFNSQDSRRYAVTERCNAVLERYTGAK